MKLITNKYPIEEQKIRELLSPSVYEFFKEAGVFLAGGAITSLFTNREINDFDIYFPDLRTVVDAVAFAFGQEDYCRYGACDGGIQEMRFHNMTNKSMMLKSNEQNIQFIHFDYFKSIEEIFNTFDFTCCMGSYDFKNEQFVFHEDFMKHNAQKYLKFNDGTAFPIVSLLRVDKYKQKGYNISKSEFIRIALKCMELQLNTWEDVKEHIGGMYGYDMSDVFDEDKECSISEVIYQLDHIDTKKIRKYIPMGDFTFEEIVKKIDDGKDIPEPAMVEREGCFYKSVREDMLSPVWSSKRLDYSVGNIVDGGSNGIYVATGLDNITYKYANVIELEPVGDVEVVKDVILGHKERVVGKLKVTKCVPYDSVCSNAVLHKYKVHA